MKGWLEACTAEGGGDQPEGNNIFVYFFIFCNTIKLYYFH